MQDGRLLAIAVDPPEKAKQVVDNNKLPFPILCDTDREVIEAYGLVHEGMGPGGGDIAIPAHVLIDENGQIVSTYVSKRIQTRLHPDVTLARVKRLAG
jgi:peroxiredoxin